MQTNSGLNHGSWLIIENCQSTDSIKFTRRIYQLASERGFLVQKLGDIDDYPLLLLTPTRLSSGPNVLVAAGFHGEEPAGCWGILRFLEFAPHSLIERANISFLPLVNPTGFRQGERINEWGEDPNRGFCHDDSGYPNPSREGRILLAHIAVLKSAARDGFLSLHEDVDSDQFYLYTFEDTDAPSSFSESLRAEQSRYFEPYPDGVLENAKIRNGIIFRECDGSFEDLLFHEGIPRTACTETPGKLDINRRIEANARIVAAFVKFGIDISTEVA